MKYSEYSLQDFLKDEFFVKWVKNKDPHVDTFWKKWIEFNPGKREIIQQAQQIIQSLEYKNNFELTTEEYTNTFEKILAQTDKAYKKTSRLQLAGLWKSAAAVLLLFTLSYLLLISAVENSHVIVNLTQPETLSKSTLPGQKLTFALPDGSRVKLNAASTLTYKFSKEGNRVVTLKGEAFFEVQKDSLHPFIVKTAKLSTTALGTSFNVSAYEIDNKHSVSLLTGSVLVEKLSHKRHKKSAILKPGDQIIYNFQNGGFQKTHFSARNVLAWRNDVIVFKDTDFDTVIHQLERWYGVSFKILNENKKQEDTFSGVFENESLERVLEILSFSGKFKFNINDKTVTLLFMNDKKQ